MANHNTYDYIHWLKNNLKVVIACANSISVVWKILDFYNFEFGIFTICYNCIKL